MSVKYLHNTRVHNTSAAEEIVPELLKMFQPKSVIDIGCGIGSWLKLFNNYGINDYLGVDGSYVDRGLLMIDEAHYLAKDLEKDLSINRKFDLAISLEVAEHLPENCADNFVRTLVNLSDIIIFSAAIKGQDGQNHLNEQFPEYWKKKFEERNYHLIYNLSSETWNNNKVEWWYQQNILVYQKKELNKPGIDLKFYVHPELYKKKLNEIEELKLKNQSIYQGKIFVLSAFKIFIKSVLHTSHYHK
jgi:SAM-dependent methyltransferase